MSSDGRRGLDRLFLGSQARRILAQSPIPILICK
jgi:nucleotide-binding universal stress UspA family protein